MRTYHLKWLEAHPERTTAWLEARLAEGFDVHHIDGDWRNENPDNLVLIESSDHMRLHGSRLLGRVVRVIPKSDRDIKIT